MRPMVAPSSGLGSGKTSKVSTCPTPTTRQSRARGSACSPRRARRLGQWLAATHGLPDQLAQLLAIHHIDGTNLEHYIPLAQSGARSGSVRHDLAQHRTCPWPQNAYFAKQLGVCFAAVDL